MCWQKITIWKYPLEICDEQQLQVPYPSRVLSVGVDAPGACLWVLVNTENEKAPMRIRIRGTGHPIESAKDWTYLGHVIQAPFIWHVLAYSEHIRPWLLMGERP